MPIIFKNILTSIFVIYFFVLPAQNEFSKWYFGNQAGLDFATTPPTILTNGVFNAVEGGATISDGSGNLLFYTDGMTVINSTHTTMANGTGLLGHWSSTQSAIIVKQPGNTTIYYIFTTGAFGGVLNYSIVDMALAAGLGSVTVKNSSLYSTTCEKQVAVRHCNGKDVWIVTHDFGSNQFRTYLLNSSGLVLPPLISSIGEVPGGANSSYRGQLKISPDGKKLAMATFTTSVPISLGSGGFQLFDFDPSSGVVSNSLTLLSGSVSPSAAYGVEFSPDGTKLYGLNSPLAPTNPTASTLYQWNICAGNNTAIIASQYSINLVGFTDVGSVQSAINGKIYLATGGQNLSVINNPNSSGSAMNLILNGQSIAPKVGYAGLPNYINSYTKSGPIPFTNTINCQTTYFAAPPVPTFSSGCTSTPYGPNAYLWDFGEPNSGSANSSTLTSPVHTYSTTGSYSVSLILYNPCSNDTLKKVVTVTTPGPTLNVTGNFNICKGEKRIYTATGANTYTWSNNTIASTATLSPTTNTVYSISASLNGCTASKQFTVTVSPCTGIVSNEKTEELRIFPNPVKDLLSIDAVNATSVVIFDMNGTPIMESKINKGHNELNTAELKPGVYNIEASCEKGTWHSRLIKID